MTALLELRGIEVGYGDVQVLRGLSLEVNPGEIVTLLGSNGAGKTTALRAICGLRPLLAGEIFFDGEPISAVPGHQRAGLQCGDVV